MIGVRLDPLAGDNQPDVPNDLTGTTGITLDQCHELLRLSTLRKTGPQGVTDFYDYLKRTRDDAIRSLLTTVDTRLSEAGLSPRVLMPTPLLPLVRVAPLQQPNPGRWAGFRLRMMTDDVTLTIDRIGFAVSSPLTVEFEMFEEVLSPSGPDLSVGTVDVTGSVNGHWQDVTLPLMENGKTYLLLYRQDDLGEVQTFNSFTRWPRGGCGGCGKGRCWSKYLQVESVEVDADGIVTPNQGTNWGINLVVSAVGDVTGRLVMDPKRLLPALRLQLAETFLRKIAFSDRKNGLAEDAINGALFDLTDKDNADRVPVKLSRAVGALVKAMQAEASAALDVDDSDDVTWGSL